MSLIKQDLISPSKYKIKCPYEMKPLGIAMHNTANNASAKNEISYMKNNNNQISYHIAVDDKEAIQAIPFNRNAWACGDGDNGLGNRRYISIEICYSKSGGTRFIEAEKRAAKVVAEICKKYGWGIDKIKAHRDFAKKNCPHRTNMTAFKKLVETELKGNNSNTSTNKSTWYRAVSGSFKDVNKASKRMADLKAKGFTGVFIDNYVKDGVTYKRVIAGSFRNKSNAEQRIKDMKAKGFDGGFVVAFEK